MSVVQMRIDITMAFEDVQYLEYIVDIAEDDDVAVVRKTSNAVTELWPQSSHLSR
ncbi:hypothetical protein PMI11_02840 [Rhizobium sp. CF142]|nr:hypothetical protein PMI11_02840 [Rhizobium sp. CF142]